MAARRDLGQRIRIDGRFRPLSQLSRMLFLGRIGSDKRLLDPAMLSPKSGVTRRRGDTHPLHAGAGPGRDETADDDIFLQTLETVDLALNRSFREDRVVSWKEAAEMKLRVWRLA